MKIEVKSKQNNKEVKLPCLMTMKGAEGENIILAFSEDRDYYQGVALKHRILEVGEIASCVIKSLWIPFEGEIVLSNK